MRAPQQLPSLVYVSLAALPARHEGDQPEQARRLCQGVLEKEARGEEAEARKERRACEKRPRSRGRGCRCCRAALAREKLSLLQSGDRDAVDDFVQRSKEEENERKREQEKRARKAAAAEVEEEEGSEGSEDEEEDE